MVLFSLNCDYFHNIVLYQKQHKELLNLAISLKRLDIVKVLLARGARVDDHGAKVDAEVDYHTLSKAIHDDDE